MLEKVKADRPSFEYELRDLFEVQPTMTEEGVDVSNTAPLMPLSLLRYELHVTEIQYLFGQISGGNSTCALPDEALPLKRNKDGTYQPLQGDVVESGKDWHLKCDLDYHEVRMSSLQPIFTDK